ncbi:uncharacterized protein [Hoplias malabaricus]|uniref:uncharacterized protein n=1 Tax=Hoplias malabaricus TaxID=27720 RepID=UPI0034635606
MSNNTEPRATESEETGSPSGQEMDSVNQHQRDRLQQRIQPRVLNVLNSLIQRHEAESGPVRAFYEQLAQTITSEVVTLLAGNGQSSAPDIDPCAPDSSVETVEELDTVEEQGQRKQVCFHFGNSEETISECSTARNEVDSSSCCPRLRGVCTSTREGLRRLFGRASRLFSNRVAPAPESPSSRSEPRFRAGEMMAIVRLADYLQLSHYSPAEALRKPHVQLLLRLLTEEHIVGFLEELLDLVLEDPVYRGATVDPQEVYSHLMHMAGSLRNLQTMAASQSQDFYRILAEAIVRSAFNVPPNALLFRGCPEGSTPLREIPTSWDRGAVVEPTARRRLRCPFRLPKIQLRWLRRRRT